VELNFTEKLQVQNEELRAENERMRSALEEIINSAGAFGTVAYGNRVDKLARAALKE